MFAMVQLQDGKLPDGVPVQGGLFMRMESEIDASYVRDVILFVNECIRLFPSEPHVKHEPVLVTYFTYPVNVARRSYGFACHHPGAVDAFDAIAACVHPTESVRIWYFEPED